MRSDMIQLDPLPMSASKRIFDIIIGSLALLCSLPIWLLIAIAIKIDSSGPIFFGSYPDGTPVLRVGRGGQLFHFVKFRTMILNDHHSRYDMQSHRAGPLVKITDDPRITRVGKFLRKVSLDELPNLIAVIRGDMSLVGPRPHLPEEVAKYSNAEKQVLRGTPGITGLPQVSGRSDLSFEKEVQLDLHYLKVQSLWLDIQILFRTIWVVLAPNHKE